ncbi:L,D-transpeptidase family protein [Loktanella sp. SALINAS62]|uniref:L,D-transpeptidase family protein n=1 Tax=Loktanella sp. SALINAS62 TaxID=2706124 RepID=UPI001B8C2531|nr:L,D-transpeptidase family protein [Loktanella sp. SALINAS62]MBS1302473.1 L,D-transpeptidase family protein [Loktanella sp. SALINAS62]
MTLTRRFAILGALGAFLSACAGKPARFLTYDGPPVTRIQVFKTQRIIQLLHKNQLLKQYNMEMGFTPDGHKVFEGDGRTPEGAYLIDRRNPNSRFHLSLGISYPNSRDIAAARALGKEPGGDIFIHGTPQNYLGEKDWTWGCIAVTNAEMEEIYAMVSKGTQIFIYP